MDPHSCWVTREWLPSDGPTSPNGWRLIFYTSERAKPRASRARGHGGSLPREADPSADILKSIAQRNAGCMAKKGRRGRKFRRYLKGQISRQLDLGTLAARTLISGIVGDTVKERTWLSSVKLAWSLSKFTIALDDGPIMVGVAHSDYTDVEIEAWIESTGSWDEADLVQQEIGRRKIRRVGVIAPAPDGANVPAVLSEGRMVHTKCGWILNAGQTVRIWAYNMGASALATTDPDLDAEGHANLWPL